MKNMSTRYFVVIFVLITFLSCTKADPAAPTGNLNRGDWNTPFATDIMYNAGDSMVIRGDTSREDQTALLQSRLQPYLRDVNYENFPAFNALVWTWSGVMGNDRSLMRFSLARVPKRYHDNPPAITKVLLYLYQYQRNDGLDIYGVRQTVPNRAELHRVKGDWTSSTVTWNNQPALASGSANPLEDVVEIPGIATPLPPGVQDDIVVDITAMVRRMIANNSNKGFMLKLTKAEENNPYCGRSFGSFACPLTSKQPRLVIYF